MFDRLRGNAHAILNWVIEKKEEGRGKKEEERRKKEEERRKKYFCAYS
ncbi:MAG: hypothetical protein ABI180_00690 [Microcoleus sp.]